MNDGTERRGGTNTGHRYITRVPECYVFRFKRTGYPSYYKRFRTLADALRFRDDHVRGFV